MSYNDARRWLIVSSLTMLAIYGTFLILAPFTRYPIEYGQSHQILQILFPLFVGYLSSAVVFIFDDQDVKNYRETVGLLESLIKGPFYVVSLLMLITFLSFGLSNWPSNITMGEGMSFENLSNTISLIISLHTGITSSLVLYLFKKEKNA